MLLTEPDQFANILRDGLVKKASKVRTYVHGYRVLSDHNVI
jgi:hypothetical protein